MATIMKTFEYENWNKAINEILVEEMDATPKPQYEEYMGVETTNEAVIERMTVGGLQPMRSVDIEDGNAIEDRYVNGYITSSRMKAYRKEVSFSSELLETADNASNNQLKEKVQDLSYIIPSSRDGVAAGTIRNMTSTNPKFLLGDGKPLLTTLAPSAGGYGTQSNTFSGGVQKPLNYANAQELENVLYEYVSQAGNTLITAHPGQNMILFCTPAMKHEAFKVADVDSVDQPDTADRNVNWFRRGANYDVLVIDRLQYANAKQYGETSGITKGSTADVFSTMWGLMDVNMVKRFWKMYVRENYMDGMFDYEVDKRNQALSKFAYDKFLINISSRIGFAASLGNSSTLSV